MVPVWLHALSIAYLCLGVGSSVVIAVDLFRHPQHMWIMNVVWPVIALFGTGRFAWQYFAYGRLASHGQIGAARQRHEDPPSRTQTPFATMVGNGAL